MTRKRSPVAILIVLANLMVWTFVLPNCATVTPQRAALRAAEVSFTTYESVSDAVVYRTKDLLSISYARTLTEGERAEVVALNDLRTLLDQYAEAHNIYVYALRMRHGEDQARQKIVKMWQQVRDAAIDLKLHFNAVSL